MKTIKYFAAILTLVSASFTATAAEAVTTDNDSQSMGYISASGATTLDSLEAKLAAKADAAGANSFRIISTTGQNKLHGTAEIYK